MRAGSFGGATPRPMLRCRGARKGWSQEVHTVDGNCRLPLEAALLGSQTGNIPPLEVCHGREEPMKCQNQSHKRHFRRAAACG